MSVPDKAVEAGWLAGPHSLGPGTVRNIIEAALPHLSPRPDACLRLDPEVGLEHEGYSCSTHNMPWGECTPRPDAVDGPVHASRCGDTSVHDPHQHGGGRWLCVGVDTPAPAPVETLVEHAKTCGGCRRCDFVDEIEIAALDLDMSRRDAERVLRAGYRKAT